MNIPFHRVECDGNELSYLKEVLGSGWLTTSGFAKRLEDGFVEATGAKHAIAVNSCTSALHLAVEAAGVRSGDRVLVPTLTFTSTAGVVRYVGGEVVLCDVDPGTGLLTPAILEDALSRNSDIRLVMPVHFAGLAADIAGLNEVADRYGVRIVEDAAHAFPAKYPRTGDVVGSADSVACCFSFYANKTITTGEGGMLVTNDDEVAARARLMRLHGIDRDVWKRFQDPGPSWRYDVVEAGFKYNLPDLNAAVGVAQLERAEALREARQRLADRYFARLGNVAGLDLPPHADGRDAHAWHLFAVHVRPDASVDRDTLSERLAAMGVATSVHYRPLHRMSFWKAQSESRPESFPGAERRWEGTLSLPLFSGMTDAEQDHVCTSIASVLGSNAPVIEIPPREQVSAGGVD
jgi:dTDP-4-amino-4,6-dideoxygalactose transaminase